MSWNAKHGGLWKPGAVSARHGGVWKPGTAYARHNGVWKPVVSESFAISLIGIYTGGNVAAFNLSGVDFGAESPTREIFAAVTWRSSATRNMTGTTAGGVTATRGTQAALGATYGMRSAWAAVPSGLTGTVGVTFSGLVQSYSCALYRVVARPGIGSGHTNHRAASNPGTNALTLSGVSLASQGFVISALVTSLVGAGVIGVSGFSMALDGVNSGRGHGSTPIRAAGSGNVAWSWDNVIAALAASWSFE